LKQQGVRAIVLLIHEGGEQSGGSDPNGCDKFDGAISRIVSRLTPDIRIVISGHTHQHYNCTLSGRHVTSAGSFGRMFTRLDVTIDRSDGSISNVTATNQIVSRDVPRDPVQTEIMAKYQAVSAPIANRVVGSVDADITRATNRAGESALGDVIADAQLAATSAPENGAAVVAFTNSGGIRADVVAASRSGDERPGEVTYSELFTVQPFGNVMTVVTLTGEMLRRLLEQQFPDPAAGGMSILQVSGGFSYQYRLNAPPGAHIVPGSMKIDGRPIAADERIRVATSSFLATGGGGFTVFQEGTDPLGGEFDVDALVGYFRTHSPVQPGPMNRIVRVD
jgi:5'-nucleotidase